MIRNTKETSTTSVKINKEIYDKFRTLNIKLKFTLQELVIKSIYLFITDKNYRNNILNFRIPTLNEDDSLSESENSETNEIKANEVKLHVSASFVEVSSLTQDTATTQTCVVSGTNSGECGCNCSPITDTLTSENSDKIQ